LNGLKNNGSNPLQIVPLFFLEKEKNVPFETIVFIVFIIFYYFLGCLKKQKNVKVKNIEFDVINKSEEIPKPML
jgi:hypothetical protein